MTKYEIFIDNEMWTENDWELGATLGLLNACYKSIVWKIFLLMDNELHDYTDDYLYRSIRLEYQLSCETASSKYALLGGYIK